MTFKVAVQAGTHIHVTGDVDINRWLVAEGFQLAIGDHTVVATQPLSESRVLLACESDQGALEARRTNKCGRAKAGFGRGRTDHRLLGATPIAIEQQVCNDIAGHEEREKNTSLIFQLLELSGLGLRSRVVVVEAGECLSVRHRVGKTAFRDATGRHHHMATHREEPVKALAHRDTVSPALCHLPNTPHSHLAPSVLSSGIELPITEHVSRRRISHVVGRHGKFVDSNQYLALAGRWQISVQNFSVVIIGSVTPHFLEHGHLL